MICFQSLFLKVSLRQTFSTIVPRPLRFFFPRREARTQLILLNKILLLREEKRRFGMATLTQGKIHPFSGKPKLEIEITRSI